MLIYNNDTYIVISKIESFKANIAFDHTIYITTVSGMVHKFTYLSKEDADFALQQLKKEFNK